MKNEYKIKIKNIQNDHSANEPFHTQVTCQIVKDRPLELFGSWQVEDYEPPVATNGKVPRNEYGNVELYKPSMLPRGCVHIPGECV